MNTTNYVLSCCSTVDISKEHLDSLNVRYACFHYFLDGKEYKMMKHGYARFCTFEVEEADDTTATFLLRSDAESKACFPFDYELRVIYTLKGGATVVVRPSGTEPKIKTYFTTLGKNLAEAEAQKNELADALKPVLS